jgi:D-alanyl-D-alanine carboxypeptidase
MAIGTGFTRRRAARCCVAAIVGSAAASRRSLANVSVADVSVAKPPVRAAIDAAVGTIRKTFGGATPVPGALVGVWDGSGGSYVRGFGEADMATHRPMMPADHFRIGSNTKTFVISVLLQLVDEGKLTLDDPLGRFALGVTIPDAEHITVRQLCQMRSGLFEAYDTPELAKIDNPAGMKFDARTLIGDAVKQKPYFAPGAAYHYSNTNYLILGLLIETLTKDTVGNQIGKRLLKPFALTQTFYPDTEAMPEPWAHGYGLTKDNQWEDVSNTVPVSLTGAAGNMISDMNDMRRWVKLYVTGKTCSAASHRALTDCVPTGEGNVAFGLGLGCSAGWSGYTGGLPGYNTANYYFPPRDITIVAWVDVQADKPRPGAANALFKAIAQIMTPDHVPIQLDKPAQAAK